MEWQDPLTAFDGGLDLLADCLARCAAGDGPPPVRYAPDQAEAGPRDCSRPRPVAGYPGGRRADGGPDPTQPWWDDRGSYTLIAAPRRLPDGEPGSRLTWQRVLETLGDCYRPDLGLLLGGADGVPRPLAEHRSMSTWTPHWGPPPPSAPRGW